MSLQTLSGFKTLQTHHCVTGSMRHLYAFNGCDVSEELLLGLGEGVGFIYWQTKGQPPFLGGRAAPRPSMETIAGERTGVHVETHTTASASKARQTMLDLLKTGQPVMLQVDMGFLPYFDFGGEEYHFGGHVVVVCGCDPESEQVLIADRDGLHPIVLSDLEKARGSTFKPFPPKNGWVTLDFQGFHPPAASDTRRAIANQAAHMLRPPIRNMGVAGIRTAAERIPQWPDQMSADDIRRALFNIYLFINAVGGTGGGCFRYMFSRFLAEAAAITGEVRLGECADAFTHIGDAWEDLAVWSRDASQAPDPAAHLREAATPLRAIAEQEQAAWEMLLHVVA
jgi:hypothetical protein